MIRGKNGSLSEPSPVAGTIGAMLVIGFGIFWTIMAGSMAPPMALFGIAFILIATFGLFYNLSKSNQFNEKKQAYERRRGKALQAIHDFENGRHQLS